MYVPNHFISRPEPPRVDSKMPELKFWMALVLGVDSVVCIII
jgi:hypothetical protein